MAQRFGAGVRPRLHPADRPGVSAQDVSRGAGAISHRRLPLAAPRRQLDLPEHHIDHAVEDLVLVRDVVVQRHGFDLQAVRQPAHGERADAIRISEGDAFEDDPFPAQGGPGPRSCPISRSHCGPPLSAVDSLTLYGYLMPYGHLT